MAGHYKETEGDEMSKRSLYVPCCLSFCPSGSTV